jgi:diaminohydroxyphosphoribosylaminopyrimidine deaminase/5-amino-6-(5-phosphoribosylamino)uracil reductase
MLEPDLMRRAILLAMRGRGRVEPNPMVGCVLARDSEVVAEGYHELFGGPHAEANALSRCTDSAGLTAYVALEPCTGFPGKKTPACSAALIAAKVGRVVAACEDPNPSVSGTGLAQLREAGIQVDLGLLDTEAKQLNAAFFKRVKHDRPYVTLKWAQTADGKIAGPGGRRLAISNGKSLAVMHQLRALSDAILVGIGTVVSDDPILAARVSDPLHTPVRIVLDSQLRIGLDRQLIKTAKQLPLLIICGHAPFRKKRDYVKALNAAGAEVLALPQDNKGRVSLDDVLAELHHRRMSHVFVEPGAELAKSFLRGNFADRIWITRSPKRVDADDAPEALPVNFPVSGYFRFDDDEFTEYLNPESPVFYSVEMSPDLEVIQGSASTSL